MHDVDGVVVSHSSFLSTHFPTFVEVSVPHAGQGFGVMPKLALATVLGQDFHLNRQRKERRMSHEKTSWREACASRW
jgi:hypothetical protein